MTTAADEPNPSQDENHTIQPTPPLETLENRPHRSLTATASQRMDYLTGHELWSLKPNLTLHKLLDLPSWASLFIEERFRYESYSVPWIKHTSKGQWSTPLQSVIFGEIRPGPNFRIAAEFWDARQWGPQNPDRIDTSMVNTLNFNQFYAAGIMRNLMDQGLDLELKGGEMTLSVGSTRLIGRYAFRNTQQPFLGFQGRLYDPKNRWELLGFAETPMQLLPDARSALLENQMVWNRPVKNTFFTGLFFKTPLEGRNLFESYFYYLSKEPGKPQETEYLTPGLRFYEDVRASHFDYEIETVGQTGHTPIQGRGLSVPISGILEHAQVGYSFNYPWHPRLQVQWDYASPNFNPLFGIAVFDFGPTGILGLFERVNINSPGWRMFLSPDENVLFFLSHRFWWLADGQSRVGWTTAGLSDPSGKAGNYVGESVECSARWDAAYNFAVQAGWQILMKGRFAAQAPGAPASHSDVNYFYIESQIRL